MSLPVGSTSSSSSLNRYSGQFTHLDSKAVQMTQQFYLKFAHIVIQSRMQTDRHKLNKWFNLQTFDSLSIKEEVKFWKMKALTDPLPMILDFYLDLTNVHSEADGPTNLSMRNPETNKLESIPSKHLFYIDHSLNGQKRKKKTFVLLERWQLSSTLLTNQSNLAQLYKQGISFFRTLYSMCRLLPLYNIDMNLPVKYRLSTVKVSPSHEIDLNSCHFTKEPAISEFNFGQIEQPGCLFSAHIVYRLYPEFHATLSAPIPKDPSLIELINSIEKEQVRISSESQYSRSHDPSILLQKLKQAHLEVDPEQLSVQEIGEENNTENAEEELMFQLAE